MKHDLVLDNLHLQEINPRICGREVCAPGHTFGPAVREYYLLHYVVRGTGTFRRGQAAYTLRAGELFVIRPWETTIYAADRTDPWEYIWVGFDCAPQFAALLERDVIRLPAALRNFSAMASCAAAQEWRICGQLYDLFAQLAAGSPERTAQPDYVSRAVNYIESNYSQPIRVEAEPVMRFALGAFEAVQSGFATDSMITVARSEDMVTTAVGVQGDVTYNENANDSGTMTVTLSGTSSSLPTLRDLALRRQQVSVLLADANDDSNVYVSGDRCRITRPPDLTRAKEIGSETVTIFVPSLEYK